MFWFHFKAYGAMFVQTNLMKRQTKYKVIDFAPINVTILTISLLQPIYNVFKKV